MQDLRTLVPPLLALCRQAGDAILAYYHRPGATDVTSKEDDSPLTRADLESDRLLVRGLGSLTPALPVLTEESGAVDWRERRDWERYWLVDPLDGTREFLARTGEFTVNVALIERHRPVLGVLYVPLEASAWVGIPGVESSCYRAAGSGWEVRTAATRPLRRGATLTVLASRRHRGRRLQQCLERLRESWGPVERVNSGSALKFCQMADGRGDFYPRFSPCCEWDTAAGQAVVEAAGGAVLGMDGTPLRYNTRESLQSPHFFAIAEPEHPLWRHLSGVC